MPGHNVVGCRSLVLRSRDSPGGATVVVDGGGDVVDGDGDVVGGAGDVVGGGCDVVGGGGDVVGGGGDVVGVVVGSSENPGASPHACQPCGQRVRFGLVDGEAPLRLDRRIVVTEPGSSVPATVTVYPPPHADDEAMSASDHSEDVVCALGLVDTGPGCHVVARGPRLKRCFRSPGPVPAARLVGLMQGHHVVDVAGVDGTYRCKGQQSRPLRGRCPLLCGPQSSRS